MDAEDLKIKIKNAAVFLGVLQGLVWVLLALVCIGLYMVGGLAYVEKEETGRFKLRTPYEDEMKRELEKSHMESVNDNIYQLFIRYRTVEDKDKAKGKVRVEGIPVYGYQNFNQIMTSDAFLYVTTTHLVLNGFWLVCTWRLYMAGTQQWFLAWGICTAVVCLIDFIAFTILGSDYDKCLAEANKSIAYEEYCANTILPVFLVVAKGFTLWIINIAFATGTILIGIQNSNVS